MTGREISWDEFGDQIRAVELSAFRLETRPCYVLGHERENMEAFLAGHPVPPPDEPWWREWLVQIRKATLTHRQISRVRILEEPPTDYQRWLRWADPWHAAVGEDIRYIPRSRAEQNWLPLDHDWWLLDDERLIDIRFADTGEFASLTLVTYPAVIRDHVYWRDLARRLAIPAAQAPAA